MRRRDVGWLLLWDDRFDFFAVGIIGNGFMLGSEGDGDGDFAVEGVEFGFELLQLVLLTPCLGDDCFELGNIGFESGFTRL